MNEISILEFSACGNKQAASKLKFKSWKGNQDIRIVSALEKIIRKREWDLISVRDIPYHSLKQVEPILEIMGYKMFIDPTWKSVSQKWRYACLSVLFVRNAIKFSQIAGYFGFETTLRYVCGFFSFNGHKIYYRTSHIPCVDYTRSHLSHQIERKENMLVADIEFQKEHQNDCAICTGDYNGDVEEEDCYCRELFEEFIFMDLVSEATYETHKLDHCYISDGFNGSGISIEAEVLDDYYMQFTDHKMIAVTLKAR